MNKYTSFPDLGKAFDEVIKAIDLENNEYKNRKPADCPECKGTGKMDSSDCCDAPMDSDFLICSECNEHSSFSECQECEGTGKQNQV